MKKPAYAGFFMGAGEESVGAISVSRSWLLLHPY